MDRNIEIANGWVPLVEELIADIESEVYLYPQTIELVIDQVKQKFGGLRCYYHIEYEYDINYEKLIEKIDKLVSTAELKSYTICEVCGNSGRLRKGSYLETLCDDHSQLRLPFADGEMWGHARG